MVAGSSSPIPNRSRPTWKALVDSAFFGSRTVSSLLWAPISLAPSGASAPASGPAGGPSANWWAAVRGTPVLPRTTGTIKSMIEHSPGAIGAIEVADPRPALWPGASLFSSSQPQCGAAAMGGVKKDTISW